MGLKEYKAKRDFKVTPEPVGEVAPEQGGRREFVVHKHAATRLHYDLRLELDGVLKSWAVPKGPSYDPKTKRLAVHVEDHPYEYRKFEGVIPKGEYGAGEVIIWDRGTWAFIGEGDPEDHIAAGHIKFELDGRKLKGRWVLVRTGGHDGEHDRGKENWLLIKERDEYAHSPEGKSAEETEPASVESGLTIEDLAKENDQRAEALKPRFADEAAKAKGARKARMPKMIEPELATLVASAPAGDDWIHEIKFDGYRMLARIEGGEVRLVTRNANDWTARLLPLAASLKVLPVQEAWLDGEVAVLSEAGVTDFGSLQRALGDRRIPGVQYFVFDLMYLDGRDLTGAPVEERKRLLQQLIAEAQPDFRVRYSDHVVGSGDAFHAQACKLELEGVVSKKLGSPYKEGARTKQWLKSKCRKRQEFIIVGYTLQEGTRDCLGALLLGVHDSGGVKYIGRAGTGFTEKTGKEIMRRLKPLHLDSMPLESKPPERVKGPHWVKPELVAEVEFAELTSDDQLRQASFKGLREDKPANEVTLEEVRKTRESVGAAEKSAEAAPEPEGVPEPQELVEAQPPAAGVVKKKPSSRRKLGADVEIGGVTVSNPERIYYPESRFSKEQVLRYYDAVAKWMLPEVVKRPLMMVRCPAGIAAAYYHEDEPRGTSCFHQKHFKEDFPPSVHSVPIREKNETEDYAYVTGKAGVLELAQLGTLEFHTWGSRVDKLEFPDRIVFDMDPGEGVGWDFVTEAAFTMRDMLESLGLRSWVKTTGGKGLHVVVPLARRQEWPEVRQFAEAVSRKMVEAEPEKYLKKMTISARRGKVYVDYLRNGRGATFIAPYSTRSRPGATVATPISWHELDKGVDPKGFDITTVPKRLDKLRADPWEDLDGTRQQITAKAWEAVGGRQAG